MVATNKQAVAKRHVLFRIKRRQLFRPRVSDAICLDETPAVDLRPPPSAQLITLHLFKITGDDARQRGDNQVLARWGITWRDIA